MTHRRQILGVLAGFLIAATWASGTAAHPARQMARHDVVADSTNYQSVEQILTDTQVMVVARVESVGIDRSAPASQPASLVTLKVNHVVRGQVGKQVLVWQYRGARSQVGQVVQAPLKRGRTYLLLLAGVPRTRFFFVVGGTVGEFEYNRKTHRFTKLDPSATWEPSGFPLSLATTGAGLYPEGGQPQQEPDWLTNPSGAPGTQTVSWSTMVNDLGLSLTDVSCPSENLCVFAGYIQPPSPGQEIPAVAVSTGPFAPQGSVVGTTTALPQTSNYASSFVACSGPMLCVLSSVDGLYAATDPTSAHWTLEVPPSPEYSFGQVSCPTVSFCAVATGSGVLVSSSPLGGSSAWNYIRLGPLGLQSISCPSLTLCVAGGSGDATVGGWIETSTDPLVASTWHGGRTKSPSFAQHSGQYSVSGISCPTTAFCIAAVVAGAPLVSTDPAGGIGTWNEGANETNNPGFAVCTTLGKCTATGVGSVRTDGAATGPGIIGFPLPGVSCVSTSFCVTTTDGQLAVGKMAS
jgi:hypothetical protein